MFESSSGHLEIGPPSCAFISRDSQTEGTILELLHSSTEFTSVVQVLRRAGLGLDPLPVEQAALLPTSAVALRRTVEEAPTRKQPEQDAA